MKIAAITLISLFFLSGCFAESKPIISQNQLSFEEQLELACIQTGGIAWDSQLKSCTRDTQPISVNLNTGRIRLLMENKENGY